jgi:parallel beta-helix repeat protein
METLRLPLALALRKTAQVLIFPALAWVGVACNGDGPTGPEPVTGLNPSGGVRWVNDDAGTLLVPPGSSCSHPGYAKIQDAVDAAVPGDKIYVCEGLYVEKVTIQGAGKDNILLKSVQRWKAVIKAPAGMTGDLGDPDFRNSIVRVTGAHNVTILAFTISGPAPGCSVTSVNYGVRVDNSGSANILGNRINKIRSDPFITCGAGAAVIVGRLSSASAQIIGNVFEDYQKNGPTVVNAPSSAEISNNRVLGKGPTAVEVQNGIQVSDGATATVRHNFVSQHIYSVGGQGGTGLLFIGPGQVVSDHNTVPANDYGVYSLETPAGSIVKDSRFKSSTNDGVVSDGTNSNQLTHNASEHNGGTGIALLTGAQNNSLVKNRVNDNEDGGILLDNGSTNSLRDNHVHVNGTPSDADFTDGIRINAGTGNIIDDNHLKRNVTHDCHDETLTANTWTNNKAGSSYPAGLCGDDDADELEPITNFGWDANYPWYTAYSDAVDFDWAVGYAEFDLDSLLALLPSIKVSVGRPRPSPSQ